MSAAGGGARIGAAAGGAGAFRRWRRTCSDSVPWRESRMTRAAVGERVALLAGEKLPAQDEHLSHRVLRRGAGQPDPARTRDSNAEPSSGE